MKLLYTLGFVALAAASPAPDSPARNCFANYYYCGSTLMNIGKSTHHAFLHKRLEVIMRSL